MKKWNWNNPITWKQSIIMSIIGFLAAILWCVIWFIREMADFDESVDRLKESIKNCYQKKWVHNEKEEVEA